MTSHNINNHMYDDDIQLYTSTKYNELLVTLTEIYNLTTNYKT